ncbi:hypothetical protein, partial [Winogradskyella luteola]
NYQGDNGWYSSNGTNGDAIKGMASGNYDNYKGDDISWIYYYGNNTTTIHTFLTNDLNFEYQGDNGWWSCEK